MNSPEQSNNLPGSTVNPADQVNTWLAGLSPDLELNELGYCTLANELAALVVEVPEMTAQCHVFGVVMPPPEGPGFGIWMQEAMRLNLMGKPLFGAWLAYDPDESALFLCRNFAIASTTPEEFAAAAQEMAETIVAVRERLTLDEETADELLAEATLAGL